MLQFHSFRLDTVNHCLWRGENREVLTPKAFDVLRYLVEHAERLVTQEELLEALWPETYVNPEVIKKYILGIRKVLSDRHEKPEFIKTFPRRGYQFIAPVRRADGDASSALCITGAQRVAGRDAALEELGSNIGRALMGQQSFVRVTGKAASGKAAICDEIPRGVAPMTTILILVVSDTGTVQVCSRQP